LIQVFEVRQHGRVQIEDGYIGADANRHAHSVGASGSATDHNHAARSDTRNAAQQDAAAAVGHLQRPRSELDRELAGDARHRCEQR